MQRIGECTYRVYYRILVIQGIGALAYRDIGEWLCKV